MERWKVSKKNKESAFTPRSTTEKSATRRRDFSTYLVMCVCQREHTDRQLMAETCVALHRGSRDAPCSNVHVPLPDRNLGRQQGYPWAQIGENLLSRCTNAVDRHTVRADLCVDDSDTVLAGSHMARFPSWCAREEAHACWQSIWKASSPLVAACYSGRKAGLSHLLPFSD